MKRNKTLGDVVRGAVLAGAVSVASLGMYGCGIRYDKVPSRIEIARVEEFRNEKVIRAIQDIYRHPEKYADKKFRESEKDIESGLKEINKKDYKSDDNEGIEKLKRDMPWIDLKNTSLADRIMIERYAIMEAVSGMFDGKKEFDTSYIPSVKEIKRANPDCSKEYIEMVRNIYFDPTGYLEKTQGIGLYSKKRNEVININKKNIDERFAEKISREMPWVDLNDLNYPDKILIYTVRKQLQSGHKRK